mgnify:CR=1 FL=1
MSIPLSIQDLVPVSEGTTAPQALSRVADLARLGDEMGYVRLWYAEHHSMANIASASPEVLIANAASATARIRVGAGGVMLPNHVPLRVAETYRTLAALYPERIDLGIGRAGGADQKAIRALRSAGGEDFSKLMSELMQFDRSGYPPEHPFGGVQVVPGEMRLPPIWILGSSGASAQSAGAAGFGYAFASHFSPAPADVALNAYRDGFRPGPDFPEPHAILCVAAIAAETEEEAEYLYGSTALTWLYLMSGSPQKIPSPETAAAYPYTAMDERVLEERRRLAIVGTPDFVRAEIERRAEAAGADEVMIASIAYDHAARLKSYRLIAEAFAA